MKRSQRKRIASIALCFLWSPCVTGCDGGNAQDRYAPGLGEIMTLIQMRHAKLWLAGDAQNWPLASYEVKEIGEGLADAVEFHPTHKGSPVSIAEVTPTMMNGPMEDVKGAIEDKDLDAFAKAFDSLTAACNNCHQSTAFRFNVVTKPKGDFFANQDFGLPDEEKK